MQRENSGKTDHKLVDYGLTLDHKQAFFSFHNVWKKMSHHLKTMNLKTYYNSGKWGVFPLCLEQDKDAYFHDSNIMLEA